MSNPEQTTTANGQTLCVYSNSIYTFTYVTKSKYCPYSRTFDTADGEWGLRAFVAIQNGIQSVTQDNSSAADA